MTGCRSAQNRRILNLPNAITVLRIGILPVLFLVLLEPGEAMSLAISILFILAALTDLLDGYVARRYNIVTRIGKLLDPIADKIIMSAAHVLLIPVGRVPGLGCGPHDHGGLCGRGAAEYGRSGRSCYRGKPLGKYKTFCQIIAVWPSSFITPSTGSTRSIGTMLPTSPWPCPCGRGLIIW